MDIYVVVDGQRVVGAASSLQGGEEVRADEARRRASQRVDGRIPALTGDARRRAFDGYYAGAYDRMTVQNTELRDDE